MIYGSWKKRHRISGTYGYNCSSQSMRFKCQCFERMISEGLFVDMGCGVEYFIPPRSTLLGPEVGVITVNIARPSTTNFKYL